MAELGGPSLFGAAAFTLIFVATQILAIGRLVSQENAPLLVAIEYFLWEMPYYLLAGRADGDAVRHAALDAAALGR